MWRKLREINVKHDNYGKGQKSAAFGFIQNIVQALHCQFIQFIYWIFKVQLFFCKPEAVLFNERMHKISFYPVLQKEVEKAIVIHSALELKTIVTIDKMSGN